MPQAICLMLSVLVALLSGCGESATERGNNYAVRMAELEKKEIDIFKTFLMTATKESLKDPGSAQFNNVSYYGTYLNFNDGKRVKLNTHTICGDINAKNSYGGYVGFRQFFATLSWDEDKKEVRDGTLFVQISDGESGHLRDIYLRAQSQFCKNHEMKEGESKNNQ